MGRLKNKLLGDTPYPYSPGFAAGSDTSRTAARMAKPSASKLRAAILEHIKTHGPATCDQIEVALGILHQTASARIREMCMTGDLRDTGQRRNTRTDTPAAIYDIPRGCPHCGYHHPPDGMCV